MKKKKHPSKVRMAAAAPALRIDKKMEESKTRKPMPDVAPKDQAFERNFTQDGKPRLNASVGKGEGAMGQRR